MIFPPPVGDISDSRDIRRYPSDLDKVPTRRAMQIGEAGRTATFSEVAVRLNDAHGDETAPVEPPAQNSKPFSLWEKEDFGFADFIDIINPLQHIPIVATLYRNLSGDQIAAAPRVIGGAVWGRLGGLVGGIVNAAVEWWSGKDIGDHIYAAVFGPSNHEPGATAVAKAKAPAGGESSVFVGGIETLPPGSGESAVKNTLESPPAAPPENGDGIHSQMTPALRVAISSYEKNLEWGEPADSLRVRFPA